MSAAFAISLPSLGLLFSSKLMTSGILGLNFTDPFTGESVTTWNVKFVEEPQGIYSNATTSSRCNRITFFFHQTHSLFVHGCQYYAVQCVLEVATLSKEMKTKSVENHKRICFLTKWGGIAVENYNNSPKSNQIKSKCEWVTHFGGIACSKRVLDNVHVERISLKHTRVGTYCAEFKIQTK